MDRMQAKVALDNYVRLHGGKMCWRQEGDDEVGSYKNPQLTVRVVLMAGGYTLRILRPREEIGTNLKLYDQIPGVVGVEDQEWYGVECIQRSYSAWKDEEIIMTLNRLYRLAGCLGKNWTESDLGKQIECLKL